jgi:uncharacterized lipoprotein YddW (UPF0748 family)
VWLTTVENLDWPKTKIRRKADIGVQKSELVAMLDSLKRLNVNTVLLQTRLRGNVIYPSKIEPFAHVLTGVEGRDPGYDPLAFAIEECHKRGMQLHAWIVTMPLGTDEHVSRQGSLALSRKKKNLCTHYTGQWYMEPGNPGTAEHITGIVKEIVSNYNVDGIHLDYIRYPDRTTGYPDASLYRKYGKGQSLASWRRGNITRVVNAVYGAVKELKPWVRVSCSPLGKYDTLSRYSSRGWDAYNSVYQAAQEWVRDGVMDILFPMLYFEGNNFYPFVLDWLENSSGRHIVPGIGIYRLLPEYGGWRDVEVERQLRTSRSAGCAGTGMFRAEHMLGIGKTVYASVYTEPALVPPMTWASAAPASPAGFVANRDVSGVSLEWNAVTVPGNFPCMRYNVYMAIGDTVDTGDISNLFASDVTGTSFRCDCRVAGNITVAVTAVNAYGIESEPAVAVLKNACSYLVSGYIVLPDSVSEGWRMVVTDMYGRDVYDGRYSRKIIVRGLCPGHYRLKVYDRHGSLLHSTRFFR